MLVGLAGSLEFFEDTSYFTKKLGLWSYLFKGKNDLRQLEINKIWLIKYAILLEKESKED